MNERPRPPRAAERAHREIRERILRGDLGPGDMLSENGLADDLGMSRTPVRSALDRLQDEGWVTIYPQRGALVRELDEVELHEASVVRHALECAGVQGSTTPRREALRPALAGNLRDQRAALEGGEVTTFARLALDFHRAFAALSGSTTALEIYDRLQARQLVSIVRSAPRLTQQPHEVLEDHRDLLELAASGDWVSFTERLQQHRVQHEAAETGVRHPAAG